MESSSLIRSKVPEIRPGCGRRPVGGRTAGLTEGAVRRPTQWPSHEPSPLARMRLQATSPVRGPAGDDFGPAGPLPTGPAWRAFYQAACRPLAVGAREGRLAPRHPGRAQGRVESTSDQPARTQRLTRGLGRGSGSNRCATGRRAGRSRSSNGLVPPPRQVGAWSQPGRTRPDRPERDIGPGPMRLRGQEIGCRQGLARADDRRPPKGQDSRGTLVVHHCHRLSSRAKARIGPSGVGAERRVAPGAPDPSVVLARGDPRPRAQTARPGGGCTAQVGCTPSRPTA